MIVDLIVDFYSICYLIENGDELLSRNVILNQEIAWK